MSGSNNVDIDSVLDMGSSGIPQGIPHLRSGSQPSRFGPVPKTSESLQAFPLRKPRSKSQTAADEVDIDALLDIQNHSKTLHSSISNLVTSADGKVRARSGSSSSVSRSQHVVKTKTRPPRFSNAITTSESDISSNQRIKTFVVDLDHQDIDTVLKVSKFGRWQSPDNARQASVKSADTGEEPGNTSYSESSADQSDVTSYRNSIASDQVLMPFQRKPLKALVYTAGSESYKVMPAYNTDIDTLVSVAERDEKKTQQAPTKWERNMEHSVDAINMQKRVITRPRAKTFFTAPETVIDTSRTPGLLSPGPLEELKKFRSASALPRATDSDIDDLLKLSFSNQLALPTRHGTARSEDMTGVMVARQIDSDFFVRVNETSQNGSRDYKQVLNSPDYRVNASTSYLHEQKQSPDIDTVQDIQVLRGSRASLSEKDKENHVFPGAIFGGGRPAPISVSDVKESRHVVSSNDDIDSVIKLADTPSKLSKKSNNVGSSGSGMDIKRQGDSVSLPRLGQASSTKLDGSSKPQINTVQSNSKKNVGAASHAVAK